MSPSYPAIRGVKPCIYKYAIKLSRNNWIDLSSFKSLKKSKRVFSVYKWDSYTGISFGVGPDTTFSGWILWLNYKDRKWEKVADEADKTFSFEGSPLVPAHIFFKTGEEFKEWLGGDAVQSLFVDLL